MNQNQVSPFNCCYEPLSKYPELTGSATLIAGCKGETDGEYRYFTTILGERSERLLRSDISATELEQLSRSLQREYDAAGVDFRIWSWGFSVPGIPDTEYIRFWQEPQ